MSCTTCDLHGGLERVRYFSRQLITADDMTTEQRYFRERSRRHNRLAHGWGVVCGCDVVPASDADHPWRVRVCPGYVLGPHGDEIVIGDAILFDLEDGSPVGSDPCVKAFPCPPGRSTSPTAPPTPAYLAIRYAECDTRPQHVHPLGCSCDERACEYSRTRDDFELRLLWELPASHVEANQRDNQLRGALELARRMEEPPPVPPCPPCPPDPWVVLARIFVPSSRTVLLGAGSVGYQGRRVLYSTAALQLKIAYGL
jgi:hypothetical protein